MQEVPEAALEWCLDYSISSNLELAHISNVCQSWRRVVVQKLCEDPRVDARAAPKLLLPGMIAEFRRRSGDWEGVEQNTLDDASPLDTSQESCDAVLEARRSPIPKKARSEFFARNESTDGIIQKRNNISLIKESFCAIWLHSEGIDEVKVALSPDNDIVPIRANPFQTKANSTNNHFMRARETRKVHLLDRERTTFEICAESWLGYHRPFEILKHFGYTESFIKAVFDTIVASTGVTTAESLLDETRTGETTFAVRGATIARPESFCLCYDSTKEKASRLQENPSGDEVEDVRRRLESQDTETAQLKERYDLQRDVLPRVIDARYADHLGKRNRSVQFLNASGGHAVCMMTPYFECGSLPVPLTIVLVGIATEDGCFLSGLHSGVEVGHLYPENGMIENTELSSVCIASRPVVSICGKADTRTDENGSLSHDESDQGFRCRCLFDGVADKLAEPSDDTSDNACVHRGRSGPGRWHCYTFIVDGKDCQIRIDGNNEPMESSSFDRMDDHGASLRLDGLTIGSDNCFDVSLCCGAGSDGEGEGAIAELAVFQGRLHSSDIGILEHRLMSKFGIPKFEAPLWIDTDLERKAQSLLTDVEAPYWQGRVPLDFLSRHRSVSWNYCDPVSGKRIQSKKIGCRPGAESSDWDE